MKIEALHRLRAGRETGTGAGALFYCTETENFLILLRSDDGDDGNCWCCLGGGVDDDDPDIRHTVRREAFEEAGLDMDHPYDLHLVGVKHYPDGFKFTNFLALVDEEFYPVLNEEHKGYQWCKYKDFPENMHQGMMEVFHTPEGQRVLKQHTTALDY